MFTAFSLKNSQPLTTDELNWLHSMLGEYSMTMPGLWLQTLPWTKFKFKWCPAMTPENGVMGCFSPIHPDTIFLQPFANADVEIKDPSGRSSWIEQLFPTIVHELCHARQWQLVKVFYIICSLPGLREFTLEKYANAAGKAAMAFTKSWIQKMDYISASKRGMAEKVFPEDEDEN